MSYEPSRWSDLHVVTTLIVFVAFILLVGTVAYNIREYNEHALVNDLVLKCTPALVAACAHNVESINVDCKTVTK